MTAAALAFVIGFLLSFFATPLTGRLALRYDVLDRPQLDPAGHKKHAEPVPYLGGIAIFIGLCAGSASLFWTTEGIPVRDYLLTIAAGVGLALVGLIDDVRTTPRSFRLAAQVVVAALAYKFGFRVESAPFEWLNFAITIVWIVGITNAFNLLDNMDGVSAGIAGIAGLAFCAMGITAHLPLLPVVAASLSGAAFGFLVHNRHPAKVFMGDSGSLFLGFLLALLGIRLRFSNLPEVTFMVPVVVLGVPILDTTIVVISRFRNGRPIFLGGRDHIAHRLVAYGLQTKAAVLLMYWASACLGWLGLVISRSGPQVGFMLLGFVIAVLVYFGIVLLRVPIYETVPPPEGEI